MSWRTNRCLNEIQFKLFISRALSFPCYRRTARRIVRLLSDMSGVEVHHRAASKVVIVLEGADSGVVGARLAEIAVLDGVLSANMVFEQMERSRRSRGTINVALASRHAKGNAAAIAAAAANISLPAEAQPIAGGVGSLEIKWSKAPCRFCGTGCGVMVGVKEGKVVATHGDTLAEVNRGLNCIKGYFLSKIMYGGDRLTTPLLRKKNGAFDKDGELTPVSWDEAFDVMAAARRRC